MIIGDEKRPVERAMDSAFSKLRSVVGADTVVGHPVNTADGASIIPVSRVSMGFITGGGEYGINEDTATFPFASGSGVGVSVMPVGFLISDGKSVKFVGVEDKSAYEKIIDTVPEIIKSFVKNNDKKKN